MKLLKSVHSDFTRLGGSLEQKFEKQTMDQHYVAINYGESPGKTRINMKIIYQHDDVKAMIADTLSGLNLQLKDDVVVMFKVKVQEKNTLKQIT